MTGGGMEHGAPQAVGGLAAALRAAGHPVPVYPLAEALAEALAGPAGAGGAAGPAVVLLDRWTPAEADRLSRLAYASGPVCVPIRLDGGLALVGPVLRPGGRTCLGCAERARLRVFGPDVPAGPDLLLGGALAPAAVPAVAAVAAAALAAPDRYDGTVVAVRGDHATTTTHPVRPSPPGCPICSRLPPDRPAAAKVPLVPVPATSDWSMRGHNPRADADRLRAELHDFRHGPVARLRRTEQSVLALVTAELAGDQPIRDAGHGRSGDFAHAERVALLEAAERMTGRRPHRCRTVLTASFAELGPQRAVDPVRLGLPDPRFDGHPRSRTVPYSPQLRTRWVYGWSLSRDRPVAVPEHVAYWGVPPRLAPRFVHENSNGCGLGNSLVEAALYGLFEVAERDAFLMAWYARAPLPLVQLPEDDPVLPHLADRLDALGYDLLLFDATNDLRIPAVLALARHRDPGSGAPQAFFAAGAHPDPLAAMRSAAVEVAVDVASLPDHVRRRPGHLDRARLLPMLTDPELVVSVDDHVALHTLPEAGSRYGFLTRDQQPQPWPARWPGQPPPVADLAAYLTRTVRRLAHLDLEVIVVNQTDPALRDRLGLHCAKVIMPGTLPMTFGHVNRRVRGLTRLSRVPHQLGWSPAPLRHEELALHPHPFP